MVENVQSILDFYGIFFGWFAYSLQPNKNQSFIS